MTIERDELAQRIEQIVVSSETLIAFPRGRREVPTVWRLVEDVLRWHVFLDDTLEPDVDVELRSELAVVRARPDRGSCPQYVAVLAVPAPFQIESARITFRDGVLELRVHAGDRE